MRARSPQARRIFLQLSRRWVIALLIALPLVAFWPSLMGNFVEWDDRENFLGNQGFRGLGWANIRWAFTAHQLGVAKIGIAARSSAGNKSAASEWAPLLNINVGWSF